MINAGEFIQDFMAMGFSRKEAIHMAREEVASRLRLANKQAEKENNGRMMRLEIKQKQYRAVV